MKAFYYFLCFDKETKQPFENFQPTDNFGLTNLFTLAHLNLVKTLHLHTEKELDNHSKDTFSYSQTDLHSQQFQRCKYSELELQEQNEIFFPYMEKKLNPNPKEIFWHLTYNQHFSFMTYSRII